MSAIGSRVVLSRTDFDRCVELARRIGTRTTGWWIFKRVIETGGDAFHDAWRDVSGNEVDFDHSGHAFGAYAIAQETINGVDILGGQLAEAHDALSRAFTGASAHPSGTPPFPTLDAARLAAHCRDEYGEDAEGMAEAIAAADAFHRAGLAEATADQIVVFIVS